MTVGLGMPDTPAPTLAPRRTTRQLMVGDVGVGSDYPISVQSMCTTKTHDVADHQLARGAPGGKRGRRGIRHPQANGHCSPSLYWKIRIGLTTSAVTVSSM